jgi:Flp pilus assembly protein TadB
MTSRRGRQRANPLATVVGAFVLVFLVVALATGSPVWGLCGAMYAAALALPRMGGRRRDRRARQRLIREAVDHATRRDHRVDRIIARRWPAPPTDRTGRSR